jgi:hypothetical protein
MKTFTRFAIAAIVVFSVAFMSVNHAWAANPAVTTGGPGSIHVSDPPWFADFPNSALPEGCTASLSASGFSTPFDVSPYPSTGHTLHMLSAIVLTTTCETVFVDPVLVCFRTPASGGAIFWLEPKLEQWVSFANFQAYPTFDGVPYTCVDSWVVGTFGFGYIIP